MPNTFPSTMTAWTPPDDWPMITTIDMHTESEVDRSPTGTGVSARAAIHHSRGEIGPSSS